MRISDWSSDVCSSDLVAVAARQIEIGEAEDVFAGTTLQRVVAGEAGKEIVARTAAEAVRRTVSAEHIVDSTADDVLDGDRLLGNAGSFHHAFRQVGLDHFPGIWEEAGVAAEAAFVAVDAKIGKIGSASCRERVCQ